jgi:hypothetical protein
METLSFYTLWSARFPSARLAKGNTLTLRLAYIDTLKLYTKAHGAKVWLW